MRLTRFPLLGLVLLLLGLPSVRMLNSSAAPATPPADADKAWEELLGQSGMPQTPEKWRTAEPSEAEVDRFRTAEGERLAKAADLAQQFAKRFPAHERAQEAQTKEYELLRMAFQLGNTNVLIRLDALEEVKLKDPQLTDEERFHIRANAVSRKAMLKMAEGRNAGFEELEKGARQLLKDFPNRTEPYEMLQAVATEGDPTHGAKLAKEIGESAAPAQIKDAVKPLLYYGKPLSIKFTAVDGRQVDVEKLRGKVVLVDFWATWCGPCVREIPNVRAAYQKLQPKGFEIVGISFDQDKEKLTSFVKEQKMPWPQYFDGKQWDNDYGKRFGIQGIPAMWLVDKKGILRELNAREDLVEKVEKLLAEPGVR